jgi:enhancing lycopene biosynthesis protein 2
LKFRISLRTIRGLNYFAPDKNQFHTVNHITGEATEEVRNVSVESARIAKGECKSLNELSANDYDGLIIPGGFGATKNLNKCSIAGPDAEIDKMFRELFRRS